MDLLCRMLDPNPITRISPVEVLEHPFIKEKELEKLKATSKEYLWREDLTEFLNKLDEFEQKQLANQQVANKKGQKKDGARKKPNKLSSPIKGIRIAPHISGELKKKVSAANEKKDKNLEKRSVCSWRVV